ncbi:hypothetical protein [uncultured Tistrella sp.]|uniref:hypothetical protein n=1 Tax=Tistrella mobilis TaxID=171437 RepID=UPI000C0A8EFD|nr:hypothetical protein [uncultured Tistrella sp.]MAM73912.1 hypothetical protein [Tistrella sp.]
MADDFYWGVFIRLYPHQLPNWSGSGGLWAECPDIINGTAPLDTDTLLKNYPNPPTAVPPPTPFLLNQPNYVYVTAENCKDEVINARVWMFWAVQSTCLYPSTWQSAGITVDGHAINYQPLSLQAAPEWTDHSKKPKMGPPAVTTTPFVVTPTGSAQDSYSLITIVENEPSNPPKAPLPPTFNSVSDLASWVSDNGNVGWLNMSLSDGGLTRQVD